MTLPPVPPALEPLARLARGFPDLEGHVVWQDDAGFHRQEAEDLGLDPEEIAFYAEGLLAEGFHLRWAVLAEIDAPAVPLILELTCREGAAPEAPPLPEGWMTARLAPSRPAQLAEGRAAPLF